jgi:acyl-CoA thioester hydrolase
VHAARSEHIAWRQHKVHVDATHIDIMGHVNNLVYLKWLEEADIEHMKAQGLDIELYRACNCGLVVRQRTLEYLAAAYPGDELVVHTGSQLLDALRLRRLYEVVAQPRDAVDQLGPWQQRRQDLVVRGESLWVAVDMRTRKPRRMPSALMEAVQQ